MKNSGLFLNMVKWCFLGSFWGFNVIVVCFWCVWHSSRSVKNACFSQFFEAFVGWFILVYFGFGRFRCFCVSCVLFLFFCVAFVSVLSALFLFCCWIVFGVVFLLLFCFFFFFVFFVLVFFCFLFFCFFVGGFKGQVRWPKGPPHLALKPSLFSFCFCSFWFLFFIFSLLSFLVFYRQKYLFPP